MSTSRRSSREQNIPAGGQRFNFPEDCHLLVTSAGRILSWDSGGSNIIFSSSKSGIAAAREAKDGSGVLAIADKQVVVLHDTKRGLEKSWGLEAEQDEVRHLEYTQDTKSLFLCTNLTAGIQQYSTERTRLLDSTNIHTSPPVALAISLTGHAMVSASAQPPAVYLKHLAHNSSPILIEPRISTATVSVISFHPERANIFLLAFRDGSIAAYDSTRIGRPQGGQFANQQLVSHGQISSFVKLHRATNEKGKFASITGAAFLPGFKTRAVTVGGDGRCRIIDFAGKGEVLRTWHAKAPATSVSVLPRKDSQQARSPFARPRASHTMGGPTSMESIIAVGRADGAVQIYDSVGLLLDQRVLSEGGQRIISVEWIKGPHLRPISSTCLSPRASCATLIPPEATSRDTDDRSARLNGARPTDEGAGTNRPSRRFTIHPDEAEEGTVRHTPMPGQPQIMPAENGVYLDLFSPVKPTASRPQPTDQHRFGSPVRARPRISSQTFIKSPEYEPMTAESMIASQRNIALFPSTEDTEQEGPPEETAVPAAQGTQSTSEQRITWKPSDRRRSRRSLGLRTLPPQPNKNAKVLADLRKMRTTRAVKAHGGVLAAFRPADAPSVQSAGRGSVSSPNPRRQAHLDTEADSLDALEKFDNSRRKKNWLVDSEQDDMLGEDIWLTSDTDDDTTRRSRKPNATAGRRSPARQTSRSRVVPGGTLSANPDAQARVDAPATLRSVHGSAEEDEGMYTVQSHVSASGNFSPSSNDVRELFPRTSSLSPRKHKTKARSPAKRSHRHREPGNAERKTLREVTLNTAHMRQAKTPWAKMQASKAALAPVDQSQQVRDPPDTQRATILDGTSEDSTIEPESHCAVCEPTQARVAGLEGEVARLRGEVLALKAVLRRNGLQAPKRC